MPETPTRAVPRRATTHATHGGANQDDARGADINTLVAQYRKSGTVPNIAQREPYYTLDLDPRDLVAAYELVATADERFRDLPADVRKAADHDPARLLEMVQDDSQRDLLESAGLVLSENPSPEKYTSPQETPSFSPDMGEEVVSPTEGT